MEQNNPLLVYKNDTNDSFIRFDLIKDEHFEPAFEIALATAKENLQNIIENKEPPTFENTIEALEYVDEDLDRISAIFSNLKEAHTTKELERVANIILPRLADFGNDLLLDEVLFLRVKSVYDAKPNLKSKEQERLLDRTYKAFVRMGALLSSDQKEILRAYDRELSLLGQKFDENLLSATNAYELHITKEEDLAGIPDRVREGAKEEAVSRGKDGWVFTLKAPSIGPFLQYAENAILRKDISVASGERGMCAPFDNKPVVLDIIRLRNERARLLGYTNHAAFVLADRMAQSPDKVQSFLEDLAKEARPFAEKDFEMLRAYKEQSTNDSVLYPWDVAFYEEKLKKEKYDFDEEALRPYFEISTVIKGIFEHARLLYGIVAKQRYDIPVYHSDVAVYEISKESGEHVGLLYMDLFPRESKRQGGWIDRLRMQEKNKEVSISPHLLIVCNLTKPTQTTPSLLTSVETETLFHEFGHALHVLLSECEYASLAGFNTLWDFVELPSQLMQSWLTEKESFKIFAKHYQTNEPLSEDEINKILKSDRFMSAWTMLAQAGAALLDLSWHTEKSDGVTDIEIFEEKIRGPYRFFKGYPGTSSTTSFKHIFSGGYDVGYYSYHWAEVLAADAFEYFKENGLFSKEIAEKFRVHILSKGNTEEPLELYRAFRGRDADPKALLRLKGLL